MKPLLTSLLLLTATSPLPSAQALTFEASFPFASGLLPDGDLNGRAEVQSISGIDGTVSQVQVRLNLRGTGPDGGWNGDLYASLQHDSGFSVLINRPGRALGSEFGSPGDGFDIVLDDSAPNGDVHGSLAGNSLLTGAWAPDGRNISPTASLQDFSSAPRAALLSSFIGLPVSGDWTLLVIDASSGGHMEIREWGLRIDYQSSPPPSSVPDGSGSPMLFTLGLLGLLAIARRGRPTFPESSGSPRTRAGISSEILPRPRFP